VCSSFFSSSSFLSHGNIVGVTIWGKIWGNNIYRGDESKYITVLEVPKLQKKYPEMANYLTHFAEA
jgi:hypothetical protein